VLTHLRRSNIFIHFLPAHHSLKGSSIKDVRPKTDFFDPPLPPVQHRPFIAFFDPPQFDRTSLTDGPLHAVKVCLMAISSLERSTSPSLCYTRRVMCIFAYTRRIGEDISVCVYDESPNNTYILPAAYLLLDELCVGPPFWIF